MTKREYEDDYEEEPERGAMYWMIWLAMFSVGFFSWMFKMRKGGAIEGNELLPFSPLQILIPLLGVFSVIVFVMGSGGTFPKIFENSFASWLFSLGILIICAGAFIHIGNAAYRKEAIMYVVRWLMPFAFLTFITLAHRHGVGWRPLAYGLALGGFMSVIVVEAYRAGVTWLPVDRKTEGRFGGLFSHPNQYGIAASTTSCVIVCLWKSGVSRFKLLAGIMIPIYLGTLFQSGSKTNIILFGACIFFCFLILAVHSPAKIMITCGTAVAVTAIAAVLGFFALELLFQVAPRDAQVIHDAIYNPGDVKSMDVREDVWDEAFRYVQQSKWVGYGPGWASDNLMKNHAHNLFLQMQIDTGVTGTFGITVLVLGCLWRMVELFARAFRAPPHMSESYLMRLCSIVAVVIYIAGNAMSDSFGTATIPSFCIFSAFAFVNSEWQPEPDGDYEEEEEFEEEYDDAEAA
jgi:O-antigen ligase